MKLRYKILGTIVLLIAGGMSVLAYTISHDVPCEPAAGRADNGDSVRAIVYRC